MALIAPALSYEALADVDLVIEAVFEEESVKKDVFGKLDKIVRHGAIPASKTSYLDLDEIAAATSRPQDVIGMHFFSPANVMRLLEVVRGKQTRNATPSPVAAKVIADLAAHKGVKPAARLVPNISSNACCSSW